MSTTTTLNPTKDNWLSELNPTTRYGNGANLKIGYSAAGDYLNGIFEFDVSAITNPSDINSALFSMTANNSTGASTNTITLARLSQDFVEFGSNWNTYNFTDAWTTAGAMDDAVTTEPTYSFTVGTTTNISVDISELVIDAIVRRSGILRFICYPTGTLASGYTWFDSRTNGSGDYPELSIVVAERIVWLGDSSSDVSTGSNWVGGSVPAAGDIALFTSGSNPALTGVVRCEKVFVGKNYKGDIGLAATSIDIMADWVNLSSRHTNFYAIINDGVGTISEVRVADAQSTGVEIDGVYSAILTRTRGSIDLKTTDATTIDAHGSQIQFTTDDDLTTVRCTGSRAILGDGATTIIAVNRATLTIESVNYAASDLTLSQSTVRLLAAEVNDITQYSGTTIFRKNEGSPIVTGDIILFGGTFDTRTQSATFTMDGATIHGGRFLVDGSQLVTVA